MNIKNLRKGQAIKINNFEKTREFFGYTNSMKKILNKTINIYSINSNKNCIIIQNEDYFNDNNNNKTFFIHVGDIIVDDGIDLNIPISKEKLFHFNEKLLIKS